MLAWRKGFYGYLVAAIAFLAYLLAGGSYYSLSVLTPAMLLNYFGNRHFAVLMGIATPIGSVLGTISPLLVGSIKDSGGSCVPAFMGWPFWPSSELRRSFWPCRPQPGMGQPDHRSRRRPASGVFRWPGSGRTKGASTASCFDL